MPRPLPRRPGASRLAALAFAAGGLVALSGCDLQEDADLERGRQLFTENCAQCHALIAAGATATVGPDLDASFAQARASGMDQDTIEGVVESQIANPRQIDEDVQDTDPELYNRVFMPAELVTGDDAEDVAAYVASVAGVPGIKPPTFTPPELFAAQGCAGCHTLQAAGATGTTGPDLDEVLPGQSPQQISRSITDPSAELTQGFQDIMPKNFGETISPGDLEKLVRFLVENAGQSGAGGA